MADLADTLNKALHIFRNQGLTLGQSGHVVRLQCDSSKDAAAVFDFLCELSNFTGLAFEGRPGGDCECFCWHDVPPKAKRKLLEEGSNVYPDTVLRYLAADKGRGIFIVLANPLQKDEDGED